MTDINGTFVFCDETTHKIRGYVTVRRDNIETQELRENEIVVEVEREPNLSVDLYVDPITGVMTTDPPA